MIVAAAVFGAAVTGVHMMTADTVARNQKLAYEKALIRLFDLAEGRKLSDRHMAERVRTRIDASEVRRDPETAWEFNLLKAYGDPERRRLKAYGFRFRGMGFWAPIEGILSVSPDLKRTMGIVILQQSETPGLGGRITERSFTDQFREGLRISPHLKGAKVLYFGQSPPAEGDPSYGRHVQSITGATQTSMAMERVLNEYVERFHRAMAAPPVRRIEHFPPEERSRGREGSD
jgi:Na+-transporting NADH:ubiquinone oxidoreductase subunit C